MIIVTPKVYKPMYKSVSSAFKTKKNNAGVVKKAAKDVLWPSATPLPQQLEHLS